MIPLSVLRKLPWKWIFLVLGALFAAGWIWAKIDAYGDAREAVGRATEGALWVSKEKAATDAHNSRVKEIDNAHHKSEVELQARLQSALDRPAVRTIRVPVSATCPRPAAESPRDASLPEAGNPPAGFVDVVDAGYESFREFLLHYAAGPSAGGRTDAPLPDRR